MSLHRISLVLPVAAALLLGGCEEKRARTTPPPQATAPTVTAADPAPTPAAQTKPASRPDPVVQVLANVEKEYEAGQANYKAGHLEAARENFDRAVDLLLRSPVPVRSDERLERAFDRIVESVHSLEMAALKQGDGFTEQNPEPAPIDEANAVTFPVDPNVKARAAEGLKTTRSDLPLVINDEVAGYINFFSTRGRGTLERAWTRAGRYREMILRILREEGVPEDLLYLAQAESGFHPLALSRAGARGMWQFMASRGTEYGLRRNWWVDERQDPEKATRAAARHLKDLHHQFGDWYLAMAAYNSGPGNVQQAVRRTGYADFWELYRRNVLPAETKNYVPIIVAVTIMAKNPAQYGLDHVLPEPPLEMETVEIDYPVDLRLVAEAIDVPVDTLRELNPSLLRMTTPKEGAFALHLPAGTKDRYLTEIAAIPADKRVLWRFHKVAPGETLAQIAKRYKTTARAVAEVNSLSDADELPASAKLIIPVTSSRSADEPAAYSKKPFRYKVRRGDTILSIADDFGVPAAKLRQWNGLKGNTLRRGRVLRIYRPIDPDLLAAEPAAGRRRGSKSNSSKSLASANGNGQVYTVRPGDTLYSIANRYGTTVAALKRDNPKLDTTLHPGDTVVIRGE